MRAARFAVFPLTVATLAIGCVGAAAQTAVPQGGASYPSLPAAQPPSDADLLSGEIRLLAADPRNLQALVRAGELALKLDDDTAAAAFFARAERIDPRNWRVKAGEGSLLVAAERPGDALRHFAEAEALGGDARSFAADRGLAYDLVGEPERAQRDYRLALRAGPNDETQRRYALSLGIAGKRELALKQIDPLLRRSDRGAWRSRAFILAMGGDRSGAEKIATSMMPAGMAQGLQPFFEILPSLRPADRAFAVHFGEVRATPERLADARMVPALAALGPDPTAPVEVAVVVRPAAVPNPREERRKARSARRDRTALAAATPPPPQTLPAPPAYSGQPIAPPVVLASNTIRVAPATVPLPRGVAPSGNAIVQRTPVPAERDPAVAQNAVPVVVPVTPRGSSAVTFAAPPVVTAPPASTIATERKPVVTPAPSASAVPPPVVVAASPTGTVAPPVATPSPPPSAAPVVVAIPPSAVVVDPVRAAPPSAVGAGPPQPIVAASPPANDPVAVVAPPVATAAGSALAVPPPPLSAGVGAAPVLAGPASLGTAAVPTFTVAASDTPATSSAVVVPSTPTPVRSEESILASIIADITVPGSELVPSPAAVPAPGRRAVAVKPVPVVEPVAQPTAAERKVADRKAAADKKAIADRKAAADKKIADAKLAAEEKRRNDPKLLEPARIWVQVAGGAYAAGLSKGWSVTRARSKAFGNRGGWTTPLRATNRILTGPFKTDDEAQSFVNAIAKDGVQGFVFVSDAGQKITKLATK